MVMMKTKAKTHKVTAVGRLLKPKNGEPRVHSTIKVDAEGKAKEARRNVLQA